MHRPPATLPGDMVFDNPNPGFGNFVRVIGAAHSPTAPKALANDT